MPAEITCVVADDQPALVLAVSLVLSEHGVDVVAQAADGEEALAAIKAYRPTVATLDVEMPRLGGIEVARRARLLAPETATILYTGHAEHELMAEALDAGARGFVLKQGSLDELVAAVTLGARGEVYVDAALAAALVRASASRRLPSLSPRERETLRLLADGKSNDEIASALLISPDTVRTYVKRAMGKLEADTRTQAVAIALRRSLIT